jgi:hypothetical protein
MLINKAMENINYKYSHNWDKINIHEYFEVEHWTKALGINREELAKAVAVAGNSADAVKKYLNK